jgi:hypothetical protein
VLCENSLLFLSQSEDQIDSNRRRMPGGREPIAPLRIQR